MPGTRTAPTVDGNVTFKTVSLTFYDHTGERRSVSFKVDAGATDAQIEALASSYQVMTNATLWRITVGEVYNSVGDSNNAIEEVWEDVDTNIVLLAKDAQDNSLNAFIPAPVNDAFIENTEEINPGYVPLANVILAWLTLVPGYSVVSGRFTQRSDIGTKINF